MERMSSTSVLKVINILEVLDRELRLLATELPALGSVMLH